MGLERSELMRCKQLKKPELVHKIAEMTVSRKRSYASWWQSQKAKLQEAQVAQAVVTEAGDTGSDADAKRQRLEWWVGSDVMSVDGESVNQSSINQINNQSQSQSIQSIIHYPIIHHPSIPFSPSSNKVVIFLYDVSWCDVLESESHYTTLLNSDFQCVRVSQWQWHIVFLNQISLTLIITLIRFCFDCSIPRFLKLFFNVAGTALGSNLIDCDFDFIGRHDGNAKFQGTRMITVYSVTVKKNQLLKCSCSHWLTDGLRLRLLFFLKRQWRRWK